MKRNLLLLILVLNGVAIHSQDPRSILQESYTKCQTVENGYFEMSRRMKYMSGNDTTSSVYHSHFKKLGEDTIYNNAFHYRYFFQDTFREGVLYTGEYFVTYYPKDSTGTTMARAQWAQEMDDYKHNYESYDPLQGKKSSPLHNYIEDDSSYTYLLIGEEIIQNKACYHVMVTEIFGPEEESMIKPLSDELHCWISKSDSIPVQYSRTFVGVMGQDTMVQYEIKTLTKYEVNYSMDEKVLTLESIPSSYKLKDYVPYERPVDLPLESLPPSWTLTSLKNETISLEELKGKVVLIDFFYKSCFPCMQALPSLQRLHEKYESQGLKVIGIDPYDDKVKDNLESFLVKRGVTYTVLLSDRELPKGYHVSGYPTIFIIDKAGKISLIQSGYGESTEATLEEHILSKL